MIKQPKVTMKEKYIKIIKESRTPFSKAYKIVLSVKIISIKSIVKLPNSFVRIA